MAWPIASILFSFLSWLVTKKPALAWHGIIRHSMGAISVKASIVTISGIFGGVSAGLAGRLSVFQFFLWLVVVVMAGRPVCEVKGVADGCQRGAGAKQLVWRVPVEGVHIWVEC